MPELPEVETIKRGLEKHIIGQKILSVEVRVPKLFIGNESEIINKNIDTVSRRGKMLQVTLADTVLAIHLKMSGQLIYAPRKGEQVIGGHPEESYFKSLPNKHTHVILTLSDGKLYYNDMRKFGWLKVIRSSELASHTAHFGPEYTDTSFTPNYIASVFRNKKIPIKQLLLDQGFVAGIGNIYADEILFESRIHPLTPASHLSKEQIGQIYEFIPIIFSRAIDAGGTSARDYRDAEGRLGTYLEIANVYKRENKACKSCGNKIKRIKIAGRSSHFCETCQPIQNLAP